MFYGNLYALLCSYFVIFPTHFKCFPETYTYSFVHILQVFLHALNVLRTPMHTTLFFLHTLNVYETLYTFLCSYFANYPARLKRFTEVYTRSFVHILSSLRLYTWQHMRSFLWASFQICMFYSSVNGMAHQLLGLEKFEKVSYHQAIWAATMWYVRPANAQIILRIRSEHLRVAWMFYDC